MKLRLIFLLVVIFAVGGIVMLSLIRSSPQLDATRWMTWMGEESHLEISESDRDLLARRLFEKVRIFCFIETAPHLLERALAVNSTWAARCNKAMFISSEPVKDLPVLTVSIPETRSNLWNKTLAGLRHCYEKELGKFDFFLKADDDTYVIMENLRAFLLTVPPSKPIAFGRKFKYKNDSQKLYLSGGAGYVFSRAALWRLFQPADPPFENRCKHYAGEDVTFGLCATAAGIDIGDSRDHLGRQRFHVLDPSANEDQLQLAPWLSRFDFFRTRQGKNCCSDFDISYHYVSVAMMKAMDKVFYQLRSLGLLRDIQTVRKILQERNFVKTKS